METEEKRRVQFVLSGLFGGGGGDDDDDDDDPPALQRRVADTVMRLLPVAHALAARRTRKDERDFPIWMLLLGLAVKSELRGCRFWFRAAPPVRGRWRQVLRQNFDHLVRGVQTASFLLFRPQRARRRQVDVCFGPGPMSMRRRVTTTTTTTTPPPFPARPGSAAHRRYAARLLAQEVWLLEMLHSRGASVMPLLRI